MKILAISGSPRANGNSTYAATYALDIIKNAGGETRFISLARKHIEYCIGCFKCCKNKICIHTDDMQEIISDLLWCDALILATPTYFGLINAQMKTYMDRCFVLRPNYDGEIKLAGKIGAGIVCGGFRNGGQEITLQNIQTFFLQNNMRVINDGPLFSHSGGIIVGEAAHDELGLSTVEHLAKNIVYHLKGSKRVD